MFKITLPFKKNQVPLYLNKFRRKPAITKFDWPFTPNYNLSQNFATFTGAIFKVFDFQFNYN